MSEQAEVCPTCGGQWVTSVFDGYLGSFYSVDYQCSCNQREEKEPKWLDTMLKKLEKELEGEHKKRTKPTKRLR